MLKIFGLSKTSQDSNFLKQWPRFYGDYIVITGLPSVSTNLDDT